MEWCIFQLKWLIPSQITKGMINLLHKRHEEKLLFNWHLIMLLNITYKIFAKSFETPLQVVLMQIIT
jgi:hypothetical protein